MENGIDMIIIQLNHNKNMRVILILIILFSSFVLNAQVAKIPYVYATKGGKTELIAENAYVKMDKPTMEISIPHSALLNSFKSSLSSLILTIIATY